MKPIAICAIFKNEARYILEWVAFHSLVGVKHFVLYDNGSEDGGADLLRHSAFGPNLTLLDWPERPGQLTAYADCIERYAQEFGWIAFIDIDEFLHPLDGDSLEEVVWDPCYQDFSEILVHWLMFGASGYSTRPKGLVLENYVYRMPLEDNANRHVKTIARGDHLLGVGTTPHIFPASGHSCNTAAVRVPNYAKLDPICHKRLVLHHYFTKSEEDWTAKLRRGRATELRTDQNLYPQTLAATADINSRMLDAKIYRFLPRLYQMLGPETGQRRNFRRLPRGI